MKLLWSSLALKQPIHKQDFCFLSDTKVYKSIDSSGVHEYKSFPKKTVFRTLKHRLFYGDEDQLLNDLNWLTKDCSLDHFSYSKLSDYEYEKLLKKIEKPIVNDYVKDLFDELFGEKKW